MRKAFIKTLIKEAEKNKKIMLLTGDLGFSLFEEFKDKFPERFINVGVAEQNMVGLAAGLALSGKIVLAYSIATFATLRPFEQIRNNIAFHHLPITIVGSGGGLCYSNASTTHHALEDIALMRSIPGITILSPADPVETTWATKKAIRLKKPVYLRLGKTGEPVLYSKNTNFHLGKGKTLLKGKDIAILATGSLVANSLKAVKLLANKGFTSTVVSLHTLKPLDTNLIKKFSRSFPLIVTVEEHSLIGGLGSAVSEVLGESKDKTRLLKIGLPDSFVKLIGSHEYLRAKLGLTPEKIAEKIWRLLKRNNK